MRVDVSARVRVDVKVVEKVDLRYIHLKKQGMDERSQKWRRKRRKESNG